MWPGALACLCNNFLPGYRSLKLLDLPISDSRQIYVHLGTGSAVESRTTEESNELWVFFLQGLQSVSNFSIRK